MKKLTLILIGMLFMCSCQDIEKSRNYFDEGVNQMMRKGDFAEAEKDFSKAIKHNKKDPELYYNRACAKFNAKKYQEAIPDFEKAIEIKPDYADAYFSLGRTYSCMHNSDMSCYYYKMAEKYGRPNLHDLLKNCP